MREALSLYPRADLDKAEEQFRLYAADPRNAGANVVLCEAKVQIEISPAEDDPTQAPIIVMGTLDQVREENGRLTIWDIKTGSPDGLDMLRNHALQLAAYQIGAGQKLDCIVHHAGIIRTKDYLKTRTGPVFWHAPWAHQQANTMLESVRNIVSSVRRGNIWLGPGDQCRYCAGNDVWNCEPKLQQLRYVK
jgi:hypothetical protein